MEFGYFTLTDNPPDYGERRQDANRLLLDTIEQALAAERLGFHSVWLPDHHFGGFGVMPTPSLCLAYVAAKTSRVKLAPATVLLPCNQPLRVAEEFAVLDRAGRLQLPHEYVEALALERRVRLTLDPDHINVWPDGGRKE